MWEIVAVRTVEVKTLGYLPPGKPTSYYSQQALDRV